MDYSGLSQLFALVVSCVGKKELGFPHRESQVGGRPWALVDLQGSGRRWVLREVVGKAQVRTRDVWFSSSL